MSVGNPSKAGGAPPSRLTMDFFESQENARRRTFFLVTMYSLAVFLIVLGTYLVVGTGVAIFLGDYLAQGGGDLREARPGESRVFSMVFFNWKFVLGVAGSVLLIIGGAMVAKIIELRQGGSSVARMLGGKPVAPDTTDPDERKLVNIVEEMSIASGMPPPALYILPGKTAINAFAAGYSPNDAAIGVTEGAIRALTRDELQGVIAHEFSHILNGDMRLNIRLIGIMHGILAIAVLGGGMMRAAFYSAAMGRRSYSRSSGRGQGGGQAQIVLVVLGLALWLIGSIGVLFSRIIKAAVSRQREFLADAAAVQFTRNPEGIAGALKKIGGIARNSRIEDAKAEEISHMFFAEALSGRVNSMIGLLSTHPPLEKRIQAIDPRWDGSFPKLGDRGLHESLRPLEHGTQQRRQPAAGAPGFPWSPGGKVSAGQQPLATGRPDQVLASIGSMNPQSLLMASVLLQSLGDDLRDKVHTKNGAQAAVFALLLQEDSVASKKGPAARSEFLPPALRQDIEAAFQQAQRLEARARLPLVELCLPALKQLPQKEANEFLAAVRKLIEADDKKTVFEFAVWKIAERHLDPAARERHQKGPRYLSMSGVKPHLTVLLSAVSWASDRGPAEAERAFKAATDSLGGQGQGLSLLPPERCTVANLSRVCDILAATTPIIKRRTLEALAHCVLADEKVSVNEVELLRAVAETLDCPMPPLDPDELGAGTGAPGPGTAG